jgi:putative redox protein
MFLGFAVSVALALMLLPRPSPEQSALKFLLASSAVSNKTEVFMNTTSRHNEHELAAKVEANSVVVASSGVGAFQQIMLDGRHVLHADEPHAVGGDDTGPGPYELLLMALGSCSSMTIHLYAAQHKWPLEQVVIRLSQARVHVQDCANCEQPDAMIHRIEKRVELVGDLSDAQRTRLLDIGDRCPVHRTLTSKIQIQSALD